VSPSLGVDSHKQLLQFLSSDPQVTAQIKVLNDDFSKVGINWTLVHIDRTVNAEWYNIDRTQEEQGKMKAALRQGSAADLNVYTVGYASDFPRCVTLRSTDLHSNSSIRRSEKQLLGYATFPYEYEEDPQNDGVVIRYNTLPGGAGAPYNLGRVSANDLVPYDHDHLMLSLV
jgi:hypothetical protein